MNRRYQHQEWSWSSIVIGIVVAATCLRVWLGPVSVLAPAQAQLPDPAAQRVQLVRAAERTNQLLAEIKTLLRDHTLKVRLEGADNQADAPAKQPGSP